MEMWEQLPKYHKDRPFEDPMLRCDLCNKLIPALRLRSLGMCECGSRKVRNVLTISGGEMEELRGKVDEAWLALFGEVPNG